MGFQKRTQFIMEIREDQGGCEMRRGWLGRDGGKCFYEEGRGCAEP